jgi:hypothetical protein
MRVLLLLLVRIAAMQALRTVSRRDAVHIACSTAACSSVGISPRCAGAASAGPPERRQLLDAIHSENSAAVESAIEALVRLDPSDGKAATSGALAGEWRLLWSEKTEAFSPLLSLPRPIRPASVQLLGAEAAARVGPGRVANLLRFPLGITLQLSSGVRPSVADTATLEILPPFRLELVAFGARQQLVEAGSDADFRALNARTAEAQSAPRNLYVQRYLDTSGAPGDLRISTVASGDPVIVGSVFVHERVK